MPRRHTTNFPGRAGLTLIVASLALSSMVWTVLAEPILNGAFWPADIQAIVVSAMGGTSSHDAAMSFVAPSWLAVFVRVVIVIGVACGLRAFVQQKMLAAFLEQVAAIVGPPGLLVLFWLLTWLITTSFVAPGLLSFVVTITPMWSAAIVALLANGLFVNPGEPSVIPVEAGIQSPRVGDAPDSRLRGNDRTRTDAGSRWPFIVVAVAAIVWVVVSFWMNERLYAGLLVPHGDSAMYEEHLWNVWHGKGFRSYLDQGLFLGEHIQVIHLLLLPLHMIWPSYLMMEFVAGISLAVCVVPIYRMTLRHSGSSRAAMWLALAWLFFFPMHFLDIAVDIKTLRPSCYGLPFLFFGIDFAERRRLVAASVCLLVALTTQEDFALVIGSIGAVLFVNSRRCKAIDLHDDRGFQCWSMGVLLFAIAWVLLAVLVVIPAFRDGQSVHYARYFGDLGSSPGDVIRSVIRQPLKVLSILLSWRTLFYALVLTAPIGLWPLRQPVILSAGLVTFVMLSLIQLGNATTPATADTSGGVSLAELPPVPYHHFHAPLLPVIFWAAASAMAPAAGIATVRANRPNPYRRTIDWLRTSVMQPSDRARFAFLCATATAVIGSMMPVGATFWSAESSRGWRNLYVPGPRADAWPKVLALIPQSARVASTDFVHTRLTHVGRSYDYSDYPRAVNNYQPGVPADTEFIVIDTAHPYSRVKALADVRELQTEPALWEVLPDETNGLFIVLRRRVSPVTDSATP